MKRAWLLVLAVSLGLNAGLLFMTLGKGRPGPVPAPGDHRPPSVERPETLLREHLLRMTESLGLDETQRAAVENVHRDLLPKIGEQFRLLGELRRSIADHYASSEFDAAQFKDLARSLSETQARLDSLVTEAMLGEAAVLTSDQRAKYAREMPWGRRGEPPPGQDRERRGERRR